MATHDRRSVLAALGLAVPFGIDTRTSAAPVGPAPGLRFRSFEDAVRAAFAEPVAGGAPWRRVEVGHSDAVRAGVQGCHNDRPFAGFAAGQLYILRTGCEPGPVVCGVRLFVATVDVITGGPATGCPLDFATLPPVPVLVEPLAGFARQRGFTESDSGGATRPASPGRQPTRMGQSSPAR